MPVRMRSLPLACAACLLLTAAPPAAEQAPETRRPMLDTRVIVEHLAADVLEGRMTGSPGIRMAADYIVEQFDAMGAVPLPALADFRQPFGYTAGVTDAGTTLRLESEGATLGAEPEAGGTTVLTVSSQVAPAAPEPFPVSPEPPAPPDPGEPPSPPASSKGRAATGPPAPPDPGELAVGALAFSESGTVEGPLIFAGYGLTVPETDEFSYDSFAALDVTDRIVVVLRYFPEDTEGEIRATLARYAGLRYKATAARERGAKGLIVVTGPRSPNAGTLVPLRFDTAVSDSGIVAATVNGALGAAIVESAGRSLKRCRRRSIPATRTSPGSSSRWRGGSTLRSRRRRRSATT